MIEPIKLLDSQVALFQVMAFLAATPLENVTGTLTIDDYDTAYIAPTGVADEYMLVPKVTINPGETIDVAVDFSAKTSDGTQIGAFSLSFQIASTEVASVPQLQLVTSLVINETEAGTIPPDPGSDTIPMYTAVPLRRLAGSKRR